MKKIIAILALAAFTFAVQAGNESGQCPSSGGCDKAKAEGKCPAGGDKQADDKKA